MHFILYPLSVLKHWIILRDVYFRVNIPSVPTPGGITQNEIHFARSFFLISRSFLLRNSSTNSDTSMSLDVNHSTTFLSFFEFFHFLPIVSRLVKMFKRIISFLCECVCGYLCVSVLVYISVRVCIAMHPYISECRVWVFACTHVSVGDYQCVVLRVVLQATQGTIFKSGRTKRTHLYIYFISLLCFIKSSCMYFSHWEKLADYFWV